MNAVNTVTVYAVYARGGPDPLLYHHCSLLVTPSPPPPAALNVGHIAEKIPPHLFRYFAAF